MIIQINQRKLRIICQISGLKSPRITKRRKRLFCQGVIIQKF